MSEKNLIDQVVQDTVLSRRSFLKWSAAVGGTAVLASQGLNLGLQSVAEAAPAQAAPATKTVWQSCMVNCGSRCPLRITVQDNKIVRVETDDTGKDEYGQHQIRSCVRGRSIRQRVYNADRLKYPMKRVGKRGEGKFEKISWEQAFDTIAGELKRIKDKYGNEAIYIHYATGTLGGTVAKAWPPHSSPIARLMNCYGGYLNHYGTYSTAQIAAAMPYTYGSSANNSIDDIANSKLIVFFGNNPAETRMSGGGVVYFMKEAKRRGDARMIHIDPRLSDTAVVDGGEWVPLRPGTDAALVSGMAYVMITENLVDQAFLDKYCIGYDEEHMPKDIPANSSYKSYILGKGADRTPKTPQWAAEITGVPAIKIAQLARESATVKPAYIAQGWGPQRHANGEESARAIAMLSILTGNVGLKGGSTGAREGAFGISVAAFPTLTNPVKASISFYMWPDAIKRGPEMTATRDGVRGVDKLTVPIKFLWNYAGNAIINQHSDCNGTVKQLENDKECEMIVVIDNHMTSSAKMADILLPDVTNFEQDDITSGSGGNMGFAIFTEKAVEPMFECKPVYEMCREIAKRLGIEDKFTEGKTQEDWLKFVVEATRKNIPTFPDYDTFRKTGIFKMKNPAGSVIALKAFRDDPVANKLTTPSGKIEIFSEALYKISKTWQLPQGDVITALPEYAPTWEGSTDALKSKYPLQLIGHHYKQRTHSTYGNVEWMQEAAPQEVWINTLDANKYGIKNGDKVRVFNDRGQVILPAKVTARIMPGVLSIPQGAWYKPDAKGVDQGGCTNTLTAYRPSPLAKGNPQHTNLVQMEKA
ncbi:MAG: molybdopterin-dependent oxidoreductase [Chloroflexi bacterium]|nr:molybdopterin-dependent oxidoreductase [Chloroflexota bacterium]